MTDTTELVARTQDGGVDLATAVSSSFVASLHEAAHYGRTRVGAVLTAAIVLVALLGPLIAPHSPTAIVGTPFSAPSSHALLGTDYVGEDVLSRVLWGGRSVLWMAIAAAAIGVGLGTTLGMLAGYGGRAADEVIMRALDLLLALPVIVFVLLFVSMLGSHVGLIVLLVGLGWVPFVARTVRGATLGLARREFIEAAAVIGTPRRRIVFRELLPNLVSIVLVEFGLRCAWSIAIVAAISYLGFGIAPPRADWGLMINENSVGLSVQPWAVVAPVVCIALFTIGVSLLTEGFSEAVSGGDRKGQG